MPLDPNIRDFIDRLEWVDKRLNGLDGAITRYKRSKPYRVRSHFQREGRNSYLVGYAVIEKPIPISIRFRISDIVHHLRASLDNLAYQLSIPQRRGVTGGRDRSRKIPERTAFPIFDCFDDFHMVSKSGKPNPRGGLFQVRGMGDIARARIEALQPYHRGQDAHLHPLWILKQLNDIDKHRMLHLLHHTVVDIRYLPSHVENLSIDAIEYTHTGPFESYTDVIRLRVTRLAHYVEVAVESDLTGDIAFDETSAAVGRKPVEVLREIHTFITKEVVPRLSDQLPW